MRILYVGPDYPGSNGTCWRDAFLELGHEVRTVDDEKFDPCPASLPAKLVRKWRKRPPAHLVGELNSLIEEEARRFAPRLIFFVKGYHLQPDTLAEVGRIAPTLVYMNDDMFNPANQTPTFHANVPLFNLILTTKSYNVREFHAAGSPRAVYIPNAYDPRVHFPAEPTEQERREMAGDVAFIGTFRPNRADFLADMADRHEFRLNIWGGGWSKMSEMGKAIRANAVTLGLLYHENRDLHTSRSFEIPACGGFMLAERTEEHRLYFEEDREAAYFSSFAELVDKTRFYVAHNEIRQRIARAGYERCLNSPYRYLDRARLAIELSGVKEQAASAASVLSIPGERRMS
jgi:spore maturation protein CgeB